MLRNGTAVPGATHSSYTISQVLPSDAGAQFMCSLRSLGLVNASGVDAWTNSQTATISVVTNAPQLTYAAAYTNYNYTNFNWAATNYITLGFNSPIDPGLSSQMSSYTLPAGWTLLGVLVNSNDYRSVALAYSGSGALPIKVTVSPSLVGLGGGLAVNNTSVTVDPVHLTDMDIGVAGMFDPAVPGMMYVTGSNAYSIQCEGTDIWGDADGFNFAYELKTNDFDVVVRVLSTTHVSNWTKAGLMVRETLDPSSRNWNIVNDRHPGMASWRPITPATAPMRSKSTPALRTRQCVRQLGSLRRHPPRARLSERLGARQAGRNGSERVFEHQRLHLAAGGPTDPGTNGQATPLTNVVYVGICQTAHDNDATGADPLLYLDTASYDSYGPPPAAPVTTILTVGRTATGNITVSWTPAGGTLLSSPALGAAADWTTVGTANPATIPITGKAQYFRVVNQ